MRHAGDDADAEAEADAYLHGGGRMGVLIEGVGVSPELLHEIAMHIAFADPVSLSREDVPAELVEKEREIYQAQLEESGKKKPPEILEKIISGKMETEQLGEFCCSSKPLRTGMSSEA